MYSLFRAAHDRTRRAFTLIETIVVLIVLALVAGIAIVGFSQYSDHARSVATRERVSEALHALQIHTTLKSAAPTKDAVLAALNSELDQVTAGDGAADGWTLVEPEGAPSLTPGTVSYDLSGQNGVEVGLATVTSAGSCILGSITNGTAQTWLIKKDLGANCAAGNAVADKADGDALEYGDPVEIGTLPAFAALAQDSKVTLTWDAVAGATGYRVYRDGKVVLTVNTTSYVDLQAKNGTKYSYQVGPFTDGTELWRSQTVTATPMPPLPAAPAAPNVTLAEVAGTGYEATVTWQPVDRADFYRVYRNGLMVGQVAGTAERVLTVKGLTANTEYTFTVSALNVLGEGAQSAATTVSKTIELPAAPTGLTLTPKPGALDAAWEATPGAAGYRVWVNGVLVRTTTSTSTPLGGLVGGRSYEVTVAAFNAAGQSATAAQSATPLASPGPEDPALLPEMPTGLRVTAKDGALDVTWTTGDRTSGTRVRVNGVLATQTTGTSATLTGLTNGTTYTVTVAAYNASGETVETAAVNGTPSTNPQTPAGEVPAPPASLAVTAKNGALEVTWTKSENSTGSRVRVDGVLATQTTNERATITGLTNGRTYQVTVAAFNAAGESAPSAAVSGTPSASAGQPTDPTQPTGPTVTIPATPTALSATPGDGKVTVTWDVDANASATQVYLDGVVRSLVPRATGATQSVILTGLTNGRTYEISVRAQNAAGQSAAASVSATVGAPSEAQSGDAYKLSARAEGDASTPARVVTSWARQAGADGYRLYRDDVVIFDGADLNFTDEQVDPDRTYTYRVVAHAAGVERTSSAPVTVHTPQALGAVQCTQSCAIPLPPFGLQAVAGDGKVTLTWEGAPGAVLNRVWIDGQLRAMVAGSATTAVVTGLTNGQTYTAAVSAASLGGESPQASPVSFTPAAGAQGASSPSDLTVDIAGTADAPLANLTWTAVPGATGYRVYRDGLMTQAVTTTTASIALTAGRAVTLRVSAVAPTGESPQSAAVTANPAPAPARSVAVTPNGDGTLRVTWAAGPGVVDDYQVTRDGSPVTTATDRSFNDTGLSAGTTYTYAVIARSATGSSAAASATGTAIGTASAPSGVALSVSGLTVTLTWDASSDAARPVSGYRVFRDGVLLSTVDQTSTSFTGTANTQYTMGVAAFNVAGQSATTASTPASVTTSPAAPTGLAAVQYGNGVGLSWNASAGAASYIVLRNGAEMTTVTGTSFVDTSAEANSTYSYRVIASSAAGRSPQSGAVNVTTVPTAPALTAVATDGRVELTWTSSAGATTYRLYRNDVLVYVGSARAYTDNTVANGVTYRYDVTASNVAGESVAGTQEVTPQVAAPQAPTVTSVNLSSSTWQATVTWAAATSGSPVTGWRVYRNGTLVGVVADPATLTFTDPTALTPGQTGTYRVAAVGLGGESAQSNAVGATRPALPAAPGGLQATPLGSGVSLVWNTSYGATGYRVYVDGVLSSTVTTPAATITGLTANQTYALAVTAFNASGEGAAATASVTPSSAARTFTYVGGNAGGMSNRDDSGFFTWLGTQAGANGAWMNPVSGGSLFGDANAVNLADHAAGAFASGQATFDPGMVLTTSGFYLNTVASTTYPVTVSGRNTAGTWVTLQIFTTSVSGYYPLTTPVPLTAVQATRGGSQAGVLEVELYGDLRYTTQATVPAQVTGASTQSVFHEQATIAWGRQAATPVGKNPVTGYRIYADGILTATVLGSATTSKTLTGLENGRTYKVTVEAFNDLGTGAMSASTNATPYLPTPTAVTGLATQPASGRALVSWTGPATTGTVPVTGYRVYADGVLVASTSNATDRAIWLDDLTNDRTYAITMSAYNTYTEGAPSAAVNVTPSGAARTFTYVGGTTGGMTLDDKGFFTWLGTQFGPNGTWYNPASVPLVTVDTQGGSLIDHSAAGIRTGQVTFDPGMVLTLNGYYLYANATSTYPTTVYGRNTAGTWVTLQTFTANQYGYVALSTPMAVTGLRATNSSNNVVMELEAYGDLRYTSSATVPAQLAGLTVTPFHEQATATWSKQYLTATGKNPVSGYRVYVDGVLSTTIVGSNSATSAVLTGLTNGRTYQVTVEAYNDLGAGPAASASAAPYLPTPAVVTGLKADPLNASAALTWNGLTNTTAVPVTGYRIYADGQLKGTAPIGTSSYVLTGLQNGAAATITVAGYNAYAEGAQSAAVTVTPTGAARTFTYTGGQSFGGGTLFDDKGLFYWMGTQVGTNGAWTNPAYSLANTMAVPVLLDRSAQNSSGSGYYQISDTVTLGDGMTIAPSGLFLARNQGQPTGKISVTGKVAGTTRTIQLASVTPPNGGIYIPLTGMPAMSSFALTVDQTYGFSEFEVYGDLRYTATATAPTAVTGVNVTAGAGQLTAAWTQQTTTGAGKTPVSGYRIYLDGALAATVNGSGTTSKVLTGLTKGQSYVVTVAAFNDLGDGPQSAGVTRAPS